MAGGKGFKLRCSLRSHKSHTCRTTQATRSSYYIASKIIFLVLWPFMNTISGLYAESDSCMCACSLASTSSLIVQIVAHTAVFSGENKFCVSHRRSMNGFLHFYSCSSVFCSTVLDINIYLSMSSIRYTDDYKLWNYFWQSKQDTHTSEIHSRCKGNFFSDSTFLALTSLNI